MGIVTKIVGKVVEKKVMSKLDSEAAEKDLENERKKADIADLNNKREESRRRAAHARKMEEQEVANKKELLIDKEKAKVSIEYLIECIGELEKEKYTYKYKNSNYKNVKLNPIDQQKVTLIANYKIPDDRDEFLLALVSIDNVYNEKDEPIIAEAWKSKYQALKARHKLYFKGDPEIKLACSRLDRKMANKRLIKIVALAVSGTVVLALIIAGLAILINNEEKIPDPLPGQTILVEESYSYFVDKDYVTVETYFTSKGFEDVTLNPLHDLVTGWISKDGAVTSVSINGKDDFPKNRWYAPTDKVIISYHSF